MFLQQPDRTDHHVKHSICVAAHTNKPDPFELCQQLGNLRRYQTRIKALVEIYSHVLTNHAPHLLDAVLAGQHVIVHKNNIPAVRAFDLLPGAVWAYGSFLLRDDAPRATPDASARKKAYGVVTLRVYGIIRLHCVYFLRQFLVYTVAGSAFDGVRRQIGTLRRKGEYLAGIHPVEREHRCPPFHGISLCFVPCGYFHQRQIREAGFITVMQSDMHSHRLLVRLNFIRLSSISSWITPI